MRVSLPCLVSPKWYRIWAKPSSLAVRRSAGADLTRTVVGLRSGELPSSRRLALGPETAAENVMSASSDFNYC